VFYSVNFFTPKLKKIKWSSIFSGSFAPHFQERKKNSGLRGPA
jgi:hypothetical protein